MNKTLSRVIALALGLGLAIGVGSFAIQKNRYQEVKADNQTITFLTTSSQIAAIGSNKTITSSGVTLTFSNVTAIAANNIQNAKDATITSSELPGNIVSVKLYSCQTTSSKTDGSFTVYGGTSSSAITTKIQEVTGLSNTAVDKLITFDGNYTFFKVVVGSERVLKHSKIDVVYAGSDPSLETLSIKLDNLTEGPFNLNYSNSHYLFYANDSSGKVDADWIVGDNTIISVSENGDNVACVTTLKPGTTTLKASASGYNPTTVNVTVSAGTLESVSVTGSLSNNQFTAGGSWNHNGLTATANYDTGYTKDVSSDATWSYNPATPTLGVESVVISATYQSVKGDSTPQAVVVTRNNPLQALYSKNNNTNVSNIYGIYVGAIDSKNVVMMDGEYGILLYNSDGINVSSYTENKTILKVNGKISIYNGLYEIVTSSITTVSSADVLEPVTYTAEGGETAEYVSRKTTVTGVPSVTTGDLSKDAGAGDVTFSFNLGGGKSIQVFYHRNSQNAEDYALLKAAVTGSSEITIKGFTSWYNSAIQVKMNGVVEADESYTAIMFSQQLLDDTKDLCDAYEGGVSSYSSYKSQLQSIWSNLASKYATLPNDQKTLLGNALRVEDGTTIEQAMTRYDFLTGKYDLSNFINGRTPMVNPYVNFNEMVGGNFNTVMLVIISSIAIGAVGISLFFIIKKKNESK